MSRPTRVWALWLILLCPGPSTANAQAPDAEDRGVPGQFFTVDQPITSAAVEQIQNAALPLITREARLGQEPVLIFEIRPGKSTFGPSYDLATFLSTKLAGTKTVAFVPEPLSGFGVLAALACGEIVLGPEASLGPITPEGQAVDPGHRVLVRTLATRKGLDPDLLVGLLDPDADLRHVQTADGRWQYVLAERLPQIVGVTREEPAWDAGRRGVLTASRARESIVRLTAKDRGTVGRAYGLRGVSDDPTLGQKPNPLWIRVEGILDSGKATTIRRHIQGARQQKVNLLFFQFNLVGGQNEAADSLADTIAGLRDVKTVALVDDRALGVAVLPVLACDEIVMATGAQMGRQDESAPPRGRGRNRVRDGQPQVPPIDEAIVGAVSRKAAELARANGYPEAVAAALIDPDVALLRAKDNQTGAAVLISNATLQADPGRYRDTVVEKPQGRPMLLTAEEAVEYRLARAVVPDTTEFQSLYGLRGQNIRVQAPSWVDGLVNALNTPFMKGVLLFFGLFMLLLELKLPGIGLPAIASALSFLLFFWSGYLSGTADQLEIILFLVGLICLAIELFVLPGFGVFGLSGIVLVLISVVMASHTFVWPTQEYEYRQMGQTLLQLTLALIGVGAAALLVGRYLPSIPLLNRMVLMPESGNPIDPTAKPAVDLGLGPTLLFLQGETGRTTTVLRPAGKARFGELLIDVVSDGDYIAPDTLVEVIDVQGSKVLVKRLGAD